MKKKLCIFIGLILFLPSIVQGAVLELTKSQEFINRGDVFNISLVLNTEEEIINALEVTLKYSDNLELENISDGNSIINLWISKPKLENNRGSIFLSGLAPGGIRTSEGIVLNLTFKSLYSGRGDIQVENAEIFLNNPDVSETEVKISNLNFEIQNNPSITPQGQKLILDFLPPDKFQIYLSRDENIFDNSWFVSFTTQDKGSGINHYEIREKFLGIFGDWENGDSPYILSDQFLLSIIEVKALDDVGRERIATFVSIRLYGFYIILIGLITSIFLFRIFKHLKIKYKKRGI